jgi:hypothetical protein
LIKKILAALAAIVAMLVVVVAMQPSSFAVERSTAIAAPADVVYDHIESLRAMDVWSPWAKMDPQMKIVYDGPDVGVGARSSWEGPRMGTGRLRITAVKPDREVELELGMLKPVEATNRVLFTLAPVDAATRVTWRMEGQNGFVGKAFSLLMNPDRMVGGEFEKGLASLKAVAEADASRPKVE